MARSAKRGSVIQRGLLLIGVLCAAMGSSPLAAAKLGEMSLERWAKLREVERYQLQIAEGYYLKQDWKVAAGEYEKYLTLYERSDGASYAQLKWSLCQVKLRKANTAIKEGFQSLLDYWPDSPEGASASYLIGRTYLDMGQVTAATKSLEQVLEDYPKQIVAVHAVVDLIEIARGRNDSDKQVELWKKLVFEIEPSNEADKHRKPAAEELARHYFSDVAFDTGVKALTQAYTNDRELVQKVSACLKDRLGRLASKTETKSKSEKLLGLGLAYLRKKIPSDTSDDAPKALAKEYWLYIVDLYVAVGANDKVPDVYQQIMKSLGTDDDMLGRLGSWYEAAGRHDEAHRIYRRFEDKIQGLSRVAQSHRHRQQTEAAVAVYRELLGRDAERAVQWTEQIARTYLEVRKYAEAIAIYQELLKLDPERTPDWLWQIATAHRDARQDKEAIGYYRQCTNFPANYKEMATCHRRLKQYREALTLYAQILSDEPSAPWTLLEIARTYEQSGQKEQAIRAFQTVCRRYPKDGHASRAHAHLQTKYGISITLGGATDE